MKVEMYTLVGSGQKEAAKQQLYHQISLRKKTKQQTSKMHINYTGWKAFGFYYADILFPNKEILFNGFFNA